MSKFSSTHVVTVTKSIDSENTGAKLTRSHSTVGSSCPPKAPFLDTDMLAANMYSIVAWNGWVGAIEDCLTSIQINLH